MYVTGDGEKCPLVLPDTLLGPETTGPAAPAPLWGWEVPASRWGVVVVAPSWWWGVVFDLWIVVASIKPHGFSCARWGVGGFVWFVVV